MIADSELSRILKFGIDPTYGRSVGCLFSGLLRRIGVGRCFVDHSIGEFRARAVDVENAAALVRRFELGRGVVEASAVDLGSHGILSGGGVAPGTAREPGEGVGKARSIVDVSGQVTS